MKPSILNKGIAQIHIAVFLFGFAGLFGKFLSCSPLYIVLGRTSFASIALFIFSRFFSKTVLFAFGKKEISFFIFQGILLAVHWWSFFLSIQISSVAVGLVTFSTFPLFVTFLEPLFFKEKLKTIDIFIAGAVFVGILLVIPNFDFSNNITKGGFFGIISGFTFALLSLVNRRNARISDSIAVAFYQNLFAAIFLVLPISTLKVEPPQLSDLPNLIFLGVVCTALAHTLFIKSLTFIRAQTAAVIAGLEPVYGIILAFFMLNEIPQARTLVGGLIIIGTTILAGRLSREKEGKRN
ncbi:DMT family transporter [Desulfobacula sp.]|uniref:DMT family transporter n=1 Tax=Desulfobacula sp. TaxID=2593537 RepID=UPI0025BFFE4A|nr:DMT family transporter [Desulfobacula sp.]MBC2702921.1 EamA family transporter [Desulfobacula sp.]